MTAQRNPVRKRIACVVFGVLFCALSSPAEAQQPKKIPRIGYLTGGSPSPRTGAFQEGLRELGYVEGKNILVEYRWAEGKIERLSSLAAELVRLKVDVIVTAGGGGATRAAKEATKTVPIVMAGDVDPVGQGSVTSLARPGGNVTGLSTLTPEISGKRLELLKEIVPKLSRVAVLGTSTGPSTARLLQEVEPVAGAFGVKLQILDIRNPKDIETAFRAAIKARVDGILVLTGPVINAQRLHIAELAVKNRLPLMYSAREHVDMGGLMYYGPSFTDLSRRAAIYVDKILKGANPADLPVEQPMKFELVINLKAAKQIGLTVPPNVLARADKVIK